MSKNPLSATHQRRAKSSAVVTATAVATAVFASAAMAGALPAPTAAATGVAKYGPDACKVLPASTVGAVIKQRVPAASDTLEGVPKAGWFGNLCLYKFPKGRVQADVSVLLVATGGSAFYAQARSEKLKWEAVSGVGDKAVAFAGSLFVLSGRYAFDVEYIPPNVGVTFGQQVTLGKDLVAALRD